MITIQNRYCAGYSRFIYMFYFFHNLGYNIIDDLINMSNKIIDSYINN